MAVPSGLTLRGKGQPQFRIDDLRHAALNGRGQFFQTSDAASLLTALRSAVAGIATRTSSAASVALNTGARTLSAACMRRALIVEVGAASSCLSRLIRYR